MRINPHISIETLSIIAVVRITTIHMPVSKKKILRRYIAKNTLEPYGNDMYPQVTLCQNSALWPAKSRIKIETHLLQALIKLLTGERFSRTIVNCSWPFEVISTMNGPGFFAIWTTVIETILLSLLPHAFRKLYIGATFYSIFEHIFRKLTSLSGRFDG